MQKVRLERRPGGCGSRAAAWLAPILLLLSSGSAGAVRLEVEEVTVSGGKIEFFPRPCLSRGETAQLQPVGKAGEWQVMVDRSSEESRSEGEIFHYFLHLASNGKPEHCFQLTATPAGTFRDQRSAVRLRVVDGEEKVEGEIQLVLHNGLEAPHYLDAELVEEPPVEGTLFGEVAISLNLTNRLENVPLTIDWIEVDADRPRRWWVQPVAVASTGSVLGPGRTKERALRVEGKASGWRAFGAALNPFTAKESHEVVTVRIGYGTEGGMPRQLDVTVPIRFEPSIFAVVVALVVGLLVGCTVPAGKYARVLGRRSFWGYWRPIVLRVAPVAVISWALGMTLVSGGSQFRLFGVTLDPDQLMTAFLIGALLGLFEVDVAVAKECFLKIFGPRSGKGFAAWLAELPQSEPTDSSAGPGDDSGDDPGADSGEVPGEDEEESP